MGYINEGKLIITGRIPRWEDPYVPPLPIDQGSDFVNVHYSCL